MSKRINKETKSLEELLKQNINSGNSIDAFEQEALEGFASLENDDEVLRLKNKLDKRFESEILEKKKKPFVIYWAAAASILLLVGIFVVFKSTLSTDKQNLALNETAENTEVTEIPSGDLKKPEAIIAEDQISSEKTSGNKEVVSGGNLKTDSRNSKPEEESEVDDINKNSPVNARSKADEQSQSSPPPAPADEFAKQGPGSADSKKITTTNSLASGGALGESSKTKDADKAMEDSERKEESKSEPKPRLIKKEKSKSKSEAAPESAAAPAQKTPSEIEGTFEKSNIGFATLTISQNDLNAKLEKFFKDKSYKKAFVCTLTINVSNQVEEVVFENKKIFKKSELKELENFLKTLKCFKSNEYSPYSTYKLSYQPQ